MTVDCIWMTAIVPEYARTELGMMEFAKDIKKELKLLCGVDCMVLRGDTDIAIGAMVYNRDEAKIAKELCRYAAQRYRLSGYPIFLDDWVYSTLVLGEGKDL